MIFHTKADYSVRARRFWRRAASRCLTAAILASLTMSPPNLVKVQAQQVAAVKKTYLPLASGHDTGANALLIEPAKLGPKSSIVIINTNPKNRNNFEYFIGDVFSARGYRVIEVNIYDQESSVEVLLPPLASAIKIARNLPGVKHVVLVGHSGGGSELSYYQEIAENAPAACQRPNRILPCDGKGIEALPKADALLLLQANIGAPHRTMSMDPAVDKDPRARNPSLDMYAPQNGFDPKTRTASYSAEFLKRYWAALHARSEAIVAEALAKLKAIKAGTGPYPDDESFIVAGLADSSGGARLNRADAKLLSRTHGAHLLLKADGTRAVQIVPSTMKPQAVSERQRNTYNGTTVDMTVRQYLAFQAVRTTPDFQITENDVKGVDWGSSANSAAGSVEHVRVPTLVMAGSCMIHMVPLEIVFDHSVAKDKEFVVVEGADHEFEPCRPEFGDSEKRAFDYVESWLGKRFLN
jgi:hypothetical protein